MAGVQDVLVLWALTDQRESARGPVSRNNNVPHSKPLLEWAAAQMGLRSEAQVKQITSESFIWIPHEAVNRDAELTILIAPWKNFKQQVGYQFGQPFQTSAKPDFAHIES